MDTEDEKIDALLARIRANQDEMRVLTDQLVRSFAFKRKHGFCPSTIATITVLPRYGHSRVTTKDGNEHFMQYNVREFLRG